MTAIAGVDVGNATTEVVIVADGAILGAGRAPTRGRKGSPESLHGAAAVVRRVARQTGAVLDEADVAIEVGDLREAVVERNQVAEAVAGFELAEFHELVGDGDAIDVLAALVEIAHAAEDAAMLFEAEVVGLESAGGLDVEVFVRRAVEDETVGDAVVGAAAGEAEARIFRLLVQRVREREEGFLEHGLHRRGEILVLLFKRLIGRAHGAVFGEIRPATSMVEVSRLIAPEMLVEIEADAWLGG